MPRCALLLSVVGAYNKGYTVRGSARPSYHSFVASLLKGAFAGSIFFVFVLLQKLNKLELFEKVVGEDSAQDVLDIFEGRM